MARTVRVSARVSIPDSDPHRLAYYVLRQRASAGERRCSQKAVAEAAGVSPQHVALVLGGSARPTKKVVDAVLEALEGRYTARQLEL